MTARLSLRQRTALRAVADGRVTYGDLYPSRTARAVARAVRDRSEGKKMTPGLGIPEGREIPVRPIAYATCDFMLDGVAIYGAEHSTFASLSERGLIDAAPNEDSSARAVELTEAGRTALG